MLCLVPELSSLRWFLCFECFADSTWFFTMLSFKESSSRHAEQKSFPAESISISPENSLTLCTTLMLFGSVEQAGFVFLTPVCGGQFTRLTRTFRFRISSDCEGARRRLKRDGTTSLELTDTELLLPASLASLTSFVDVVRVVSTVSPLVVIILVHCQYCVCVAHAHTAANDVYNNAQIQPIMLALCSMLLCTYYARFIASIISAGLTGILKMILA